MKQLVLVGILAGALAGVGYAQEAPKQTPPPAAKTKRAAKPATSQPAAAGSVLGSITLPKDVMANGQTLPKGTYQLRLSDEELKPAPGTDPSSEKWVEFVQKGQPKGKEVASVIPNSEVQKLGEDKQAPPPAGKAKVQLLKEKNYYRVWISKGGNSYLIHLPPV